MFELSKVEYIGVWYLVRLRVAVGSTIRDHVGPLHVDYRFANERGQVHRHLGQEGLGLV